MTTTQNQIGLRNSFGKIYTGATSGNSFSMTATPAEITGLSTAFTLDPLSQDFAMTTDGRLKYTGARTKTFLCFAVLCGNNVGNAIVQIYKNGSVIPGAIGRAPLNASSTVQGSLVSLAKNEYLSLFASFFSGSATPTIYTAQLCAQSMGV